MLRTCRFPTVPWQGLRQSGRCLPGDERDRTDEDRGKGKWETARKGDKTRPVAGAGQPETASGVHARDRFRGGTCEKSVTGPPDFTGGKQFSPFDDTEILRGFSRDPRVLLVSPAGTR